MDTKKCRDRRARSERFREAKQANLAAISRRRNDELLALAEKRIAMERAHAEGKTHDKSSTSNLVQQNLILSTSSAAPDLPHVYAPMDELPNGGFIESTFDDELIQMGVEIDPIFSSMPIALLSTTILEVGRQRDEFEATHGAQPLLPGRAFQLNTIEKQALRELRHMDRIVEATQEQLQWEFETRQVTETASMDLHSDEGETEVDPDERASVDDHYPSGSEAGDDNDGGGDNEDNVVMVEMLIQDGWVVEGGQYPEDDASRQWASSSGSAEKLGVIRLHQQTDTDVEVTVPPGSRLPSGLINISHENIKNPFKTVAPSHSGKVEVENISRITCLTVVILHVLAGLSHSWCEFVLHMFTYIFNALGHSDLANQIPSRFPTAMSYAGTPSHNIRIYPVCPTCGDVFPTSSGADTECPRCLIPLYKELLDSRTKPVPKARCKVLVPRICLPFLSISAQLESILSAPGIEGDVDWWRSLPRRKGYYQNISDGRVWGEILGPDGKLFFRSDSVGGKKCAPNGELRVGVALAMDWCVSCFAPLALTDAPIGSVLIGVHSRVAIVLLR